MISLAPRAWLADQRPRLPPRWRLGRSRRWVW